MIQQANNKPSLHSNIHRCNKYGCDNKLSKHRSLRSRQSWLAQMSPTAVTHKLNYHINKYQPFNQPVKVPSLSVPSSRCATNRSAIIWYCADCLNKQVFVRPLQHLYFCSLAFFIVFNRCPAKVDVIWWHRTSIRKFQELPSSNIHERRRLVQWSVRKL